MYDLHTHSNTSHDSKAVISHMCATAIEKNIEGIAICDHADICFAEEQGVYDAFKKRMTEIENAKEKYGNKLNILTGIELAEAEYDPPLTEKILGITDYDVILGSVHTVIFDNIKDSYSRINFSNGFDEERIHSFISEYFRKMLILAQNTDFDVLTHLDCPMRYINGVYKRNINISRHNREIENILSVIISRDIALEINTSGVNGELAGLLPAVAIVEKYKSMGGKLITLGSDAHTESRIGNGFETVTEFLKDAGFKSCLYFEKRIPKEIPLR